MKTDIEIKDDLYNYIKGSKLDIETTGIITKRIRPAMSDKEDVIISVLSSRNAQVQEAFVNVNVYVKDIPLTYYHVVDGYRVGTDTMEQFEEDTIRLRTLSKICEEMFQSVIGDSYIISLDSQRILAEDATKEHIINNKLLYRQLNENL